jgi:hypothetical protein
VFGEVDRQCFAEHERAQHPGCGIFLKAMYLEFYTDDVIPSKDGKDVQSVIAKDTHSVASYNPNRYPSAKRERDDSSSRKFDYGYLAALKSNLIPSDPDGKSHKKSIDNKTENNEGYNRQLADEQNRRSKLEAELSKNNMMLERMRAKI